MHFIWFDWIDLIWFDLIWCDWLNLIWSDLMSLIDCLDLIWFDIITYPYAWTVNFKICIDVQLRTYQPPIPKTSQASAWSHMYIGHLMCKTEGSPIGLGKNFECWMVGKTLGKSGRFRTSGSTFWSRSTGSRFGSVSYYALAFGTAWQARNYYHYIAKS